MISRSVLSYASYRNPCRYSSYWSDIISGLFIILSLLSSSFNSLLMSSYSRPVVSPIASTVSSIALSPGLSYTSDGLLLSGVPFFIIGTLLIILNCGLDTIFFDLQSLAKWPGLL